MRKIVTRLLFRLAYRLAPAEFHPSLFCMPGEHIGRAIVKDGNYEEPIIRTLKRLVAERFASDVDVHLIDIGANIGTHAVALADISKSVLCFEPNPISADILAANIRLNRVYDARVFPCALSDRVSAQTLSIPHGNEGKATLGQVSDPIRAVETTTSTLDRELEDYFQRTDVLLIKIDVEGHEFEVLLGAQETLRKHVCIVVLEYNKSENTQRMVTLLNTLGYHAEFQIDIPRMSTRPGYRILSLLGLVREEVIDEFCPDREYLPAVIFTKTNLHA